MSILSVVASRPIQSPSTRSALQDSARAQHASASGKVPARLPVVDPVSLSSGSVSRSQEALNARVAQLGDQTVDVAQRFIANFADSLFGDAAKGATFKFSAISLSADTSLSAGVVHAATAAGNADTAALQLNESASFVGRGQITTADGQSFDFEVEVNYQASMSARTTSAQPAQQTLAPPDTMALTGKQLPAIKFPGSLADLFKVLGRQLEVSTDSGKNDGNGGNLSLRLIRLVNSAALLAPRAPQDNPQASSVERNRALASYSEPAASTTVTSA
ncbi:MAG: hypothetical protein JWQ01_3130 [Massilia sp.]|nr:hypothetical protein [Massilia sp.]